jgi:hypothetical protein
MSCPCAEYCMRVDGQEQAQCLETLAALEQRHQAAVARQESGAEDAAQVRHLDCAHLRVFTDCFKRKCFTASTVEKLPALRQHQIKARTSVGRRCHHCVSTPCAITADGAVQAEAELERLDALTRELSACGSTKLMIDALHHLQHKIEVAASGPPAAPAPSPTHIAEREEQDRVCSLPAPSCVILV